MKTFSFSTIAITEAYDAERGVAQITVITPGFNKSKSRYYPPEVLKRDASRFEGAKMFLNHQTEAESKQRPEGDIRNWVASLRNVRADENGKIGGEAVIVNPQFKEQLSLLAKQNLLSEMGVSIRAEGKATVRKENGASFNHVESIDRARSVDFVTYPGAGGQVNMLEADTFSEDTRQENKMQLTEVEIQKLQSDLATANAALIAATAASATQKTEFDVLKTKIAESEKATRIATAQTEVEKQLKDSKLPKPAQDRIRAQFKEAEETSKLADVIKAEGDYIKSVGGVKMNLGESANEDKSVAIDWTLLGFKKEEVANAGY